MNTNTNNTNTNTNTENMNTKEGEKTMKFTKKEKAIIYHGYKSTVNALENIRDGLQVFDGDAVKIANMLNVFGITFPTVESYIMAVAIGVSRLAKVENGYKIKVNGIASFTKWNVEKAGSMLKMDVLANAGKEPTITAKKVTKTFKNPYYDALSEKGIDADTINKAVEMALKTLLAA